MLKMDSHIHSEYSPDSHAKIDDILKTAKSENIDIIAISDHNTVDGTSEVLKKSHADVLHITPYRSFPTGVTASASKRHEYLRWAQQKGRYIVEDDYDSEFSVLKKPEDTLFSQSEDDNIIYVNTFSKSISPSLRVGYMLLPKHLVPLFREKLGFYSCTVPTAIQYVLTELFRNGDFERHINRVRRAKRKDTQH